MPFIFAFVGIAFVVIGVRGQTPVATKLLVSEFTGANSFVPFLVAILVIGFTGYIRPFKPVSDAFIGLIILVIILSNQNKGGLFAKLQDALTNSPPIATPATTTQPTSASASTGDLLTQVFGSDATLQKNLQSISDLFTGFKAPAYPNFSGASLPDFTGSSVITFPSTGP